MTTLQKSSFWLVGWIVFFALTFLLRDILLPFVAGMVIAYFLDPLCDWFEDKGLSRSIATSLVTFLFFLVFILVIILVSPLIFEQIEDFAKRLPNYATQLQQKLLPLLNKTANLVGFSEKENLLGVASTYTGSAVKWFAGLISHLVGSLETFFSLLSLLVITPIVSFYILRDWDIIVAHIDSWLPRHNRAVIHEQMREIDRTLSGFIRGQAMVCSLLGGFYGIGLFLIGLEFGLIVGFLTGNISFVPYFGMLVGFVIGMALAIAQFSDLFSIVLVVCVFFIGQVLEGNILTPYLVGGRVGLHPVWIIFALLAGGSLFGFLGILMAVPVAAIIGVIVRFFLTQYLKSPFFNLSNSPKK